MFSRRFAIGPILVLLAAAWAVAAGEEVRPNILFIFTDDQSHRSVGCYEEALQFRMLLPDQGRRVCNALEQARQELHQLLDDDDPEQESNVSTP